MVPLRVETFHKHHVAGRVIHSLLTPKALPPLPFKVFLCASLIPFVAVSICNRCHLCIITAEKLEPLEGSVLGGRQQESDRQT